MGCNGWRSGTSISHPSARRSGRKGARTAPAAVQRGAVVQMAWEASQQLLTGTVREGGGGTGAGRSGRCPPRSARPQGSRCGSARATAAAPRAPTACTSPRSCSPRPTRRCCPRHGTGAGTTARRSALPWEQSLDSLLAAPQARAAPAASDVTASAPLAVELSLVQITPEPVRYPSYTTDNGRYEPPPRTPPASSSSRRGWCSRAGSAAGWPAHLSWSRLDYLLLRDEIPAAHVRLLHELLRPLPGQLAASSTTTTGATPSPATATEVPGPVRLRVPPAVARPRPGARGRACPSSTGASRAPCRRQARRSCAST